jgi:hypothetical protein
MLLAENQKCEDNVLQEMKVTNRELLSQGTMVHFSKSKLNELVAFIHIRTFETPSLPAGFKWPNKGKLKDAQDGIDCLILRAYNLCTEFAIKLNDQESGDSSDGPSDVTDSPHQESIAKKSKRLPQRNEIPRSSNRNVP